MKLSYEDALAIKPGTILWDSWGYDQTNIFFCEVLENTGKTLKCAMLRNKSKGETEFMTENVMPGEKANNKPFRLRISRGKNNPDECYLSGSYPFIEDRDDDKTHGYWWIWDGKEKMATHYA